MKQRKLFSFSCSFSLKNVSLKRLFNQRVCRGIDSHILKVICRSIS